MLGGISGGSATGSNGAFIPPGQDLVAAQLGNVATPMANTGISGENAVAATGDPAANAYLAAMGPANQYLFGGPFADQAIQGAQGAASSAQPLFNQIFGGSQLLNSGAEQGLPYAQQALANGFNPGYGQVVGGLESNPYYNTAIAGAQQGAQLSMSGANQLQGAGTGILQSGFDPQSALFNRGQQQTLDQSNAVNAMSGLAGTPYGASVSSNALGNYDINWQNQQLNRQTQAGAAASPLLQAAPQLAQTAGAMPTNTYESAMASILQGLNAQTSAGTQGGVGYNTILGGAGTGIQQAAGLGQGAVTGYGQNTAMPYNAGATVGQNAISGGTGLAGLGNNVFQGLPQNVIGDFLQYLGLGQSASQIAGNLQSQSFNQAVQGIGGVGSALGGANSLLGGGSSGGALGSLFGAGAGSTAGLTTSLADAAGIAPGLAVDAGGSALEAATVTPALDAAGSTFAAAAPLSI